MKFSEVIFWLLIDFVIPTHYEHFYLLKEKNKKKTNVKKVKMQVKPYLLYKVKWKCYMHWYLEFLLHQ